MPEDGLERLKAFDAIYLRRGRRARRARSRHALGAAPAICQSFDQYANVRPTRILPGITSPLRDIARRGPRLGDRARELRGRVCRPGRPRASRPARGGRRPRSAIFTRAGVDAHHALRFRAGPLAAAQAADRRHQVERPAPRHGDVGRDRGEVGAGVPRRDLGQDAGRRHDDADGAEARGRSTRSSPPTSMPTSCPTSRRRWPARSASRRPRTSTRSASSPRCSSRSTARPSTSPARASPIPIGDLLDRRDDAGAPGRRRGGAPPDGGDRAGDRRWQLTPDLGGKATTREVTEAVCDAIHSANS